MKTFKLLINLVFIGLIFIACDKRPNDNGNGKITSLRKSNLDGAKAAFITGKNAGRAARNTADDYEEIKLYKVGVNGDTQVVFTDDEGNVVQAVTEFIQNLSKTYAVMRVRNDEIQGQICVFIIRKSDGKLYTSDETLENGSTGWDDPLGVFTWDGFDNTGIDYSLVTKSDANGNIYFHGTGYTGTLRKIHESGGNTTVTTIAQAGEYYVFNHTGHIYLDNTSGDGSSLYADWLTPAGVRISTNYFINEGPVADTSIGKPFALSSSPESFFTIDQVNNPPSTWQKSVLSEYNIVSGNVERTVHDVFGSKRIDENSVVTSLGGLAVALVSNGLSGTGEICYIKSKTDISYSNSGTAIYFDLQNNNFSSEHYVYCYDNNDKSGSYGKIFRFDLQNGQHNLNYYSTPSGYNFVWAYVTFNDVLTVIAEDSSGQDVFIEIDASKKASEYKEHNGEKVLFRSAF